MAKGWIANFGAQSVSFSHYIRYKRIFKIIVSASLNWVKYGYDKDDEVLEVSAWKDKTAFEF